MAGIDINRTTSGVSLPPQVSTEIWSNLIEQSAVMQVARQIALPGAGITVPMITGDAEAAWVAETDEKPVSRSTISSTAMTPYKLAVIEPFSNEFRRDLPTLYAELARRLPGALSKKFDATVFGTGAVPGTGFDNMTAAPNLVVDGTGTFADLSAVLLAVAAAGGNLTGWVATPGLHGLMLTSVDGQGRQFFMSDPSTSSAVGSVFGAPVMQTRATMPSGTIGFAGDWESAIWGSVEGVQISVSDQATLTDGATTLNLWQRNMFAIRAEIEVGFKLRDATKFVEIKSA